MRVRMMSYGLGLATCCIIASSCGSQEGYAGLTKTQAMNAAEAEIAKNDYGGNRAYFQASIWSDAVRRTRSPAENRAWLIKFYDAQLLRTRCAYAWHLKVTHTLEVSCKSTQLGAGVPSDGTPPP